MARSADDPDLLAESKWKPPVVMKDERLYKKISPD
jgi:hypothetical protein